MFFSKCKKALPAIADFESILSWWRAVRNHFNRTPFFPSKTTQNLDYALSHFDIWIDEQQSILSQRYVDHLVTLSHAVSSWLADHQSTQKKSSRYHQVFMLETWIDTHLHQETKLAHRKTPTPPSSPLHTNSPLQAPLLERQHSKNFDHKLQKHGDQPQSYETLNIWWKKISKLSLLKRRSSSTRLIDKAVDFFSDSVIFDRAAACHQLLAEIDIWKMRRENNSERVEAIQQLEQYLEDQIKQLASTNKLTTLLHNACFGVMSWPLGDLDLTGLFDCLAIFSGVNA